jgi:hypothetical protein
MAIASRNGKATTLTMQHNLMAMHSAVGRSRSNQDDTNAANAVKSPGKASTPDVQTTPQAPRATGASQLSDMQSNFTRQESTRLKSGGAAITHDGLIGGKSHLSRAFGMFDSMPAVNSTPSISSIEITEQDEFLIIGSSAFWNVMDYQTAIDIARLKADDAIEAATVLRDFAIAYSNKSVYIIDEDTESPTKKSKPVATLAAKALESKNGEGSRYHVREPITCMVINLRHWSSGKPKKVFNKIKRRRDDTVDSVCGILYALNDSGHCSPCARS